MKNQDVFKQNLSEEENYGGVFSVGLLFRQYVEMPDCDTMTSVMEHHVGNVECAWHNKDGAGFAAKNYLAQFKEGAAPPLLTMLYCSTFHSSRIGDFERSQMWDCMEERDIILDECKYVVMATDMMAAGLKPKERAALDMDFLEALVELYPSCEAVLIHSCGKLLLADDIRKHTITREQRFVKFAVNARFFNIQGTNDVLVDTLGMSLLYMPDIQYHFHNTRSMDPNWVVQHAYCIADYILSNDNPIKSGDPIDGIVNGKFTQEVQWRCQYENALIQPAREVIDIYMNEYAAGNRNN